MTHDPDDKDDQSGLISVGGQVDESTATLRIMGDDLNPDEITELLRFPPTVARRKGDVRIGKKTNREYKATTGQWHLESPRGKGDLDEHVRWILDALCPDQHVWTRSEPASKLISIADYSSMIGTEALESPPH